VITDRARRRRFECPRRAAEHPHPLARAIVAVAPLLFEHRRDLASPIRNAHGNIIVRAMPELLLRPHAGESAAGLDQRRADWMQRLLAVIVTAVACADFRRKVLRNPDSFGKPGADPLLSLHRLAVEAGLSEEEYKDPVNGIERHVRFLGEVGFISKTVQWREKKIDGSFRSTGAALRRLAFAWLYHLGGDVERRARETHAEEMREAEKERLAAEEAEEAFTDAIAKLHAEPEPEPPSSPPPFEFGAAVAEPSRPDADALLFEIVEREHPEWIQRNDIQQINAELRRLRRLRVAAVPDTS
jgi:hypothetical protein